MSDQPPTTAVESLHQHITPLTAKPSAPQPHGESNPSTQTLDETGIVLAPSVVSASPTLSIDELNQHLQPQDNTPVESQSQPIPLQPDDLVCLDDVSPTATPTTTGQLKLSTTETLTFDQDQIPSALDTIDATPTTTTTITSLFPQAEALPTPQQTPIQTSQLATAPVKPTILRAPITKRSYARLENTDDTDGLTSDIKRQRSNAHTPSYSQTQQHSTTTSTTTTTTTTSTSNGNSNSNTATGNSSTKILVQQFKELSKNPPTGITVSIDQGNLHRWKVIMLGPPGTPYEGGIFPCSMTFPSDYPAHPPTFSFTPNFPHPNVFADGKVCISILHDPNDSSYEHEPQSERWKPILGIEAILLSVMSLLSEPNTNSPANVEMSKLFRDNQREYRKKIILAVRSSQEEAMSKGM